MKRARKSLIGIVSITLVTAGWLAAMVAASGAASVTASAASAPSSALGSGPAAAPLPDTREADSRVVPAPTAGSVKAPRTGAGAAAAGRAAVVALPRQIKIPAIGVDARVEFVGLTPENAMDAPKNPANAAWYELGPRPGESGNAVVAGHVDWSGRPAVFWGLGKLKEGDLVEVVAADDRRTEFVVQWQRWYDSSRAPVEEVFAQTDQREVTLISCGGVFDHNLRQYLSRVVVRGVLR